MRVKGIMSSVHNHMDSLQNDKAEIVLNSTLLIRGSSSCFTHIASFQLPRDVSHVVLSSMDWLSHKMIKLGRHASTFSFLLYAIQIRVLTQVHFVTMQIPWVHFFIICFCNSVGQASADTRVREE